MSDKPVTLRTHILVALLFPLLSGLFLGDVLFGGKSLSAFDTVLVHGSWRSVADGIHVHQPLLLDSPTAHYPERKLLWDAMKSGQNLGYDPYIFTGIERTAQGIGAFVTSLPQLFLDTREAIDWSTWLRLSLAGIFMYALIVGIGFSPVAGVFAGIAWALNLHQIAWLEFPQHLATQLWIPLLFLLNLKIAQGNYRPEYILGLLVTSILFVTSGYTQVALYTYLTVGVFNTFYLLVSGVPGYGARLRAWLAVHAILLASLAVVGIEILIEAQLIKSGLRAEQNWRWDLVAGLRIGDLARFFIHLVPPVDELMRFMAPNYYGGLWGTRFHLETRNVVEYFVYAGVASVFFALYAVLRLRTVVDRRLVVCVLAVIGVLFALYHRDPFIVKLVTLVPFAGHGGLARFQTLLVFYICLLAGIGLGAFARRDEGDKPFWIVWLVLASVPAVVRLLDPGLMFTRFYYAYAFLAALGAIVVLSRFLRPLRARTWAIAVLLAVDLFLVGYQFNTKLDNDLIFPRTNTIKFLLRDHDPYRVAVVSENILYHPNVLSYYKIATIGGYAVLVPPPYLKFLKAVAKRSVVTRNGIVFLLEARVPVLRLLGVKYVISDEEIAGDELKRVLYSDSNYVYQMKDPLARVYCASHAVAEFEPGGAVKQLPRLAGQYDRPIVLAPGVGPGGELTRNCRVDALRVYTDGLEFKVVSDRETVLSIPYNYSTWWRATVDGKSAPLLQANHVLMALKVGPGNHTVVLENRGPLFLYSAILVIVFFGFILLIALRGKKLRPLAALPLSAVSVLVIGKSALSLPMFANHHIAENPRVEIRDTITTVGIVRTEATQPSPVIGTGTAFTASFVSPLPGLRRIALYLGTYHQDGLPYAVRFRLRDATGRVIFEKEFARMDPALRDNAWVHIDFPEIRDSAGREFRIEFTADTGSHTAFSLWLDKQGRPLITTYHNADTVAAGPANRD